MRENLSRVNPIRNARKPFYGWWLCVLAAVVMVIGTVPLFQGMTAWFVVLEQTFGWSRSQLSLAFSLTRVEGSITGPGSGFLIDKLGARRMVLIGMVILGIGFILLGRVHNLWQFYLAFVVMSLGAGLGTWMPMMTVLNSWFLRRRSTAMAVAMEGFSLGSVVLVPALAWAIDPDGLGRPGWRMTATGLGVIIMVLALPLSRFVRNRPEDYGETPDGISGSETRTPSANREPGTAVDPGYTWQEAVRTKNFWLITWGHACSSTVIVSIMVHLGRMLTDRGLPLQTVGWVVAVITAVGAVFTPVGGYLGDRIPIRMGIFGFSALQSVAVAVLLGAHSLGGALVFATLMGIGFGGRNPMTTAIRGVYFGRRAFASITGVSMVPMNVLLLAAPLFAGYMFDRNGSYVLPFLVIASVSFAGSLLFLFLGPPTTAAVPRRTGR